MKLRNRVAENNFTSGSIPREMLKFAGPFILGVLVQNLYGAVDLMVVGHYATTADVSAVTVGSQLMSMVTQLIIGFATGITVIVGRECGAGNHPRLSRTVGSSIILFGIFGVALTAVYAIFSGPLVGLMNTPGEAVAAAGDYVLACSFGILFITGYNVINSVLTGLGDSRTPFIFIAIACVINVVLDIVLVKSFGMGALGAAIATSVAQAGSFIFALIYLKVKGLGFALKREHIRRDAAEDIKVMRIGAPVAIQNVLVGLSFLFIIAIINTMGVNESASVGVVEKLISFLFIPAIGMSTAVSTASAQNIGAGQYARADKSLICGIVIAIIPSIIICVYCQFWGSTLTSIFAQDADIIAISAEYLKSYVFDVILVSLVFCLNGYFNSLGQSWFSMLHSLITTFAVRVPLAYLFSAMEGAGLYTIGWAAPLSTLASLIICIPFLMWLRRRREISGGERDAAA